MSNLIYLELHCFTSVANPVVGIHGGKWLSSEARNVLDPRRFDITEISEISEVMKIFALVYLLVELKAYLNLILEAIARYSSNIGSISLEWKAFVASKTVLFMFFFSKNSENFLTTSGGPATTVCSDELTAARSNQPFGEDVKNSFWHCSTFERSLFTTNIDPLAWASMRRLLSATKVKASSKLTSPAHTAAPNSPKLWPRTMSGFSPQLSQSCERANSTQKMAVWLYSDRFKADSAWGDVGQIMGFKSKPNRSFRIFAHWSKCIRNVGHVSYKDCAIPSYCEPWPV